MNILNSKKKVILDVTNSRADILQDKISSLLSLFAILILVCIIIVTSALIFELVKDIYNSKESTVIYTQTSVEEDTATEETMMLTIGL